ncbi:unnamed protein product [Rotaria sp. Silwood2]|nr:unnamed protein product [Rotaria sp. Silwood2]CAF4405240.1 unnamed protein product [Rotaria sp. Silwood2]
MIILNSLQELYISIIHKHIDLSKIINIVIKKTFDIHRRAIHYNVGDYVLKRLTGFPSKLSALYSHSMIIIKQRHPTYFIQDPNDEKLFQVHVSQLRPINFDRFDT